MGLQDFLQVSPHELRVIPIGSPQLLSLLSVDLLEEIHQHRLISHLQLGTLRVLLVISLIPD